MNIVKYRKIYIAISTIIIIIGLGFMFYNNSKGNKIFNYDIQFTGGTTVEFNIGKEFENKDIAQIYKSEINVENAQIQKIGNGKSVSIKTKSLTQEQTKKVTDAIIKKYNLKDSDFSTRDISATISNEMKKASFLAVLISCVAMLIYISLRFKDIKIGTSAIIALIHDVLIVLSFYAIFRIPLNEAFIAAILTVLGYSINATIIIFDRMRENKIKNPSKTNEELVDGAVTQSFRRSLFTSLTTFFTVLGLYIFGVESVKIFALPIAIGIICGTYSSICIAGSIWYMISSRKKA